MWTHNRTGGRLDRYRLRPPLVELAVGHTHRHAARACVSPGTVPARCPTPAPAGRHWDGSARVTHRPRPLRVTATSPSHLLRAGQHGGCRQCGNRIDLYPRTDQRPIALHPAELAAAHVPESCRWHLSGGIAHPHGDGSAWCRIPHAVLCPRRTPTCRMSPCLKALCRQLAVRTRRLTDTGAFTPALPAGGAPAADTDIPDRPVVQMLLCRYLAERPVEGLRCVAQTRHRHRCMNPVLASTGPAGTWRLLPTGPQRGQLALSDTPQPGPPTALSAGLYPRPPAASPLRWSGRLAVAVRAGWVVTAQRAKSTSRCGSYVSGQVRVHGRSTRRSADALGQVRRDAGQVLRADLPALFQ